MTGGQVSLSLGGEQPGLAAATGAVVARKIDRGGLTLAVPRASAEELAAHEAMLAHMAERNGRSTLWQLADEGSLSSSVEVPSAAA